MIQNRSSEGIHCMTESLRANEVNWVRETPLYVIALHRLAKMNKASLYAGTNNRFVRFNLTTDALRIFAAKWPELGDAEAVTLIYRML